MALRTAYDPWLMAGDTGSDLPNSTHPGFFFDEATGALKVIIDGSAHNVVPTFTSVATLADLKAIVAANRYNGLVVLVTGFTASEQVLFYFNATSALTGDDILVVAPDAGSGRWLRVPGDVDLALPISFSTATAAVLYTVPTGARFRLRDAYWEVLSAFTGSSGGGAAAIGLSSTNMTGLTTKGNILGGASGDVLATLVTGVTAGTIGVGIDTVAELHTNTILIPGITIRFDRFTDQFTGGSGYAHLVGDLILNVGA